MMPPRNVNSHPRKNIRLVTLMNGTMRIVPPWKRVQGISRREWLRIKVTIPNLYMTHRPTVQRVVV
jgi:hypothetical protein